MTLLEQWLSLTQAWEEVFPQHRTAVRAIRQGLGALVCVGRRTLTRIIWANGAEQRSWSCEYHLHSRVKWAPRELFAPIFKGALDLCPGPLVGVAVDDTKLRKTGRCIQQAFHQRDPLWPAFHTNLILGLRFLQGSLLVPLHKRAAVSCRALPIAFEESSRVKRPGKNASDEECRAYRQECKRRNLSTHFAAMMGDIRKALDDAGGARKLPLRLIVVAPTPYRKRNSARFYYRQPAYLFTTDLADNPKTLLQIYFDRWQIEVNHREEKDSLGVGQAQLWNPLSVPRQPALVVAAYSALLLAALLAFGPNRTDAYATLPKWRRNAQRPSCLDLITRLRKEMDEHPEMIAHLQIDASLRGLAASAAA